MKGKKNGSRPTPLRTLAQTSPILSAVTVAKVLAGPNTRLYTVEIDDPSTADQLCTRITESVIMSMIMFQAGDFKQYNQDRPVVICSKEKAVDYVNETTVAVIVGTPWRSKSFPRKWDEAEWIEPFVFSEDKQAIYDNPDYVTADFEIAIHADPAKIFYDMIPVELIKTGKKYFFAISGQVTMVEDAVDVIPFRRSPSIKLLDSPTEKTT